MLKILSMGWGVQTWTLAAMVALDEHPRADFLVFADTHHEGQATYEFARKWTPWLEKRGLTIITVEAKNTDAVREDWSNAVMIPAFTKDSTTGQYGQVKRQCTHDWKIMPIRRWIRAELLRQGLRVAPASTQLWMGISLDEVQRMRTSDVKYIANVYPLVDLRMTRRDCRTWLEAHSLPVAPKSACTFCPFKRIAAWKDLKRQNGHDWQEAIAVDTFIRNRRVKASFYIHPARRPLTEAVALPEDEREHQISFSELCDNGHCGV